MTALLRTCLPLFALCALSCSREVGPDAKPTSPVVASGQGLSITAAELLSRVNERPPSERGGAAGMKQALEGLIDQEVLVAEARRQGLDKDPEIEGAMKLMLVQRLLRDRQAAAGAQAGEEALRQRFEAEKAKHLIPEAVRVRHLFLITPSPADRLTRLSEAKALRATAMDKAEGAEERFAELARKRSDEAGTAAAGGDLTFRTHAELAALYSPSVADAAFALTAPGQLSEVVESPRGLHLFWLVGRMPSREPSFEELRPSLAAIATRSSREEEVRAYAASLRQKAGVVIREDELKRLQGALPGGDGP